MIIHLRPYKTNLDYYKLIKTLKFEKNMFLSLFFMLNIIFLFRFQYIHVIPHH